MTSSAGDSVSDASMTVANDVGAKTACRSQCLKRVRIIGKDNSVRLQPGGLTVRAGDSCTGVHVLYGRCLRVVRRERCFGRETGVVRMHL